MEVGVVSAKVGWENNRLLQDPCFLFSDCLFQSFRPELRDKFGSNPVTCKLPIVWVDLSMQFEFKCTFANFQNKDFFFFNLSKHCASLQNLVSILLNLLLDFKLSNRVSIFQSFFFFSVFQIWHDIIYVPYCCCSDLLLRYQWNLMPCPEKFIATIVFFCISFLLCIMCWMYV